VLLSNLPLRPVTEAEVETFWTEGVVCLRGMIPPQWLESLMEPCEWLLSRESAGRVDLTKTAEDMRGFAPSVQKNSELKVGHFVVVSDAWKAHPAFRAFACDSPLPQIAGRLLRSKKINLYEDSVLVKEPGSKEITAFHQDYPATHAQGMQICTTWIPLDTVTSENGQLQFVKGSHRWKGRFRANYFISDRPADNTEGDIVPDFHKDPHGHILLSFDMKPGDITVHHTLTIHGAGPNVSATRRRRAISVWYCGDDARYQFKPGGDQSPRKPHHSAVQEGTVLDHEGCPVVWRAAQESV